MISGFSSFLKQEFGINSLIGSFIIVLLCYFILLKNIDGLIKVSNYLMPILIIFLIFISLNNLDFHNNYNNIFNRVNSVLPKEGGIFKSVLYASYNCILLIPVLVTLIKYIQNKNKILVTSIFNFVVTTLLSLSVYNLLLLGNQEIFNLDMPIIKIVEKYGSIYKILYVIMIAISIFTTAISTGYSFLINCIKSKKTYKTMLGIVSFFAIFSSQISFSVFVDLLYPVLGIVGIFEIFLIIKK